MRWPLSTILAAALPGALSAQRNLEVGIAPGVTHYYGDLGNINGPVQWNSMRPGLTLTFRDFLNNPKRYVTRSLTTEARVSWFRVGYDETAMIAGRTVRELRNYGRGLGFRNDLIGVSGHLVLNAYREPFQPVYQQRFFMYFHTGLGVYHGRPKADLFRGGIGPANRYWSWDDGTIRDAPQGTPGANITGKDGRYETDLYDWLAGGSGQDVKGRGRRVSPWHVAVPLGMGVRYMLTRQWSVGIEYSYLMFTDDMIDAVSGPYATHAEIAAAFPNDPVRQELARYINDPTGKGTDGTNGPRTSRRGNPGLLDTISFLNVEVSYKFKRKPARRSFVVL